MSENIADRLLYHIEKISLMLSSLEQEIIFLKFDNAWLKNNLEHEIRARKLMENKWF